MNRFKIALNRENDFENIWKKRETHLNDVPGFIEFHLVKGKSEETHTPPNRWPSVHRNPERGFRCPYRCLSARPLDQAHPCGYVRAYWHECKSGY